MERSYVRLPMSSRLFFSFLILPPTATGEGPTSCEKSESVHVVLILPQRLTANAGTRYPLLGNAIDGVMDLYACWQCRGR